MSDTVQTSHGPGHAMSDTVPYLSLCLICGDEGVGTLGRLLASVLERPSGPMVDEVVLGWNGRDDVSLGVALSPFGGRAMPVDTEWEHDGQVRFLVFRQVWRGDFAAARQETFERASGVWRGYLDSDDVVPNPEDPEGAAAIEDSLKTYGIQQTDPGASTAVGSPKSLGEHLRGLPSESNCVVLPYDYTIGGDGKALERHPRRRFVRWATGWMWHHGEYYHEDLVPTAGSREVVVINGALPIRHYPTVSVDVRMSRNRAIFQRMMKECEEGTRPREARLIYNAATFAIQDGDYPAAARLLGEAIPISKDPGDIYLYRHLRAKMLIQCGRLDEAAMEAVALIGTDPGTRHGWDLLSEIASARAWWQACLDFHALATVRSVAGWAIDRPVEREAHTRVLASGAAGQLGRYGEAVALARLAVGAAPEDALSHDALRRAEEASRTSGRLATVKALATELILEGDLNRAGSMLDAIPPWCGRDPEISGLRRALAAADRGSTTAELPPLGAGPYPSQWVLAVGRWILENGFKRVLLFGRPNDRDLDALRGGVTGVAKVFHGDEELTEDGRSGIDAVVFVDLLHTAWARTRVGSGTPPDAETPCPTAWVLPTPEVNDPARVRSLDLEGTRTILEDYGVGDVTDLALQKPSRPGGGVPRMFAITRPTSERRPRLTILSPFWAERWGPDSVREGGCGGSEEAVIYLASALARRGVAVCCYGPHDPPGGVEIRGGVEWRDIATADLEALAVATRVGHETLIFHRAPYLLSYPVMAGLPRDRAWVWPHDHTYPEGIEWSGSVAGRSSHLFVSRWQREALASAAGVATEDLTGAVIGNGIPPEEFDLPEGLGRDARRVFYASQPHRGLLALLRAWPLVLEEEPEAILEVYYGWNTAEYLAQAGGQVGIWTEIEAIRKALTETPRVFPRGRLPQVRLAAEMRRSGVLAYPTEYPEVSCITALRAAAAGCALAVSDAGALAETLPDKTFQFQAGADAGAVADKVVAAIRAVADGSYQGDAVARVVMGESSWDAVAKRLASALWPSGR